MPEDIYPVFNKIMLRPDKEKLLKQRSKTIWITGLSSSGKTTIAAGVEYELNKKGFLTQVLDGDNIRSGINNNLSFTEEDRKENIRRIAEVTKLFIDCGIITINCFISPTKDIRQQAKDIIGEKDFIEVFVNTPLEECEKRDVKGLYKKARAGLIKNFTGIDSPYEAPENPDLEIKTVGCPLEDCIKQVIDFITPHITHQD